jgi:2-amino-4-hydroxy-6-hydroxymethyldihydropteridine diphosphokinase
MFAKVVLILGGNRGDRKELINQAVKHISKKNHLVAISAIYETQAWGNVAKGNFLNQVIQLETSVSPENLLEQIQEIEETLGRKRTATWGDRTMDIDILYFGDEVIQTSKLTIPHPFIQDRRFVLIPLAEILPDMIHPVLGKSNLTLLEECHDWCEVEIFTGNQNDPL